MDDGSYITRFQGLPRKRGGQNDSVVLFDPDLFLNLWPDTPSPSADNFFAVNNPNCPHQRRFPDEQGAQALIERGRGLVFHAVVQADVHIPGMVVGELAEFTSNEL